MEGTPTVPLMRCSLQFAHFIRRRALAQFDNHSCIPPAIRSFFREVVQHFQGGVGVVVHDLKIKIADMASIQKPRRPRHPSRLRSTAPRPSSRGSSRLVAAVPRQARVVLVHVVHFRCPACSRIGLLLPPKGRALRAKQNASVRTSFQKPSPRTGRI
jgi:hypothetical protein